MGIGRRRVALMVVAMFSALALVAHGAAAQTYPSQSIRIVVPFAPGGSVDGLARLFAMKMQSSMNVPIIIDNRPGAGGNIGIDTVAKSAPDGYTILLNTNGQSISPAIYKSLPWDAFKDFTPVTQLLSTNLILAADPKLPARNLREFIALAKAQPDKLSYGSSGLGNSLHLTMELLKLRAGIDIQMVPYRGDAQIISALMGGEVQVAMIPITTGKPQVEAGALRGLAVTTNHRAKGLDVPTVAEQGIPDFDAGGYQAFFVPAKTPRAIVDRIYQEAKKALDSPDLQQQLEAFAVDPVGSTPDEFAAFYKADVKVFKRIVKEANIPLQE